MNLQGRRIMYRNGKIEKEINLFIKRTIINNVVTKEDGSFFQQIHFIDDVGIEVCVGFVCDHIYEPGDSIFIGISMYDSDGEPVVYLFGNK